MSFGPLPSQLCLLSGLPARAVGDKVRFLGCVCSYSVSSGTLKLEHQYPEGVGVSALVDVQLVLEKLGAEQTRAGEWVNVIGYITLISKAHTRGGSHGQESTVHVQALLLWSAGALDIQRYQVSVYHLLQGR